VFCVKSVCEGGKKYFRLFVKDILKKNLFGNRLEIPKFEARMVMG
jgi:hypothetical protein